MVKYLVFTTFDVDTLSVAVVQFFIYMYLGNLTLSYAKSVGERASEVLGMANCRLGRFSQNCALKQNNWPY